MITQTGKLNLIPEKGAPVVVHVSQYDVGSRTLAFRLFNDSVAFSIPANTTAAFNGKKKDGHVFTYPMTVDRSNSTVSVLVAEQMTAVGGNVECEVVLLSSNKRLATANLILSVETSPLDNGVVSDSDISFIENAISLVAEAVEESETAAEHAAASAATASTKASEASVSATNAAGSATNAAGSASSAASSASTASNKASEASASASNAAGSASTASTKASEASASASAASTSASDASGSERAAQTYRDQAKDYRDQAAGYARAVTYSFMVDSDGYLCLNHKEDPE